MDLKGLKPIRLLDSAGMPWQNHFMKSEIKKLVNSELLECDGLIERVRESLDDEIINSEKEIVESKKKILDGLEKYREVLLRMS